MSDDALKLVEAALKAKAEQHREPETGGEQASMARGEFLAQILGIERKPSDGEES